MGGWVGGLGRWEALVHVPFGQELSEARHGAADSTRVGGWVGGWVVEMSYCTSHMGGWVGGWVGKQPIRLGT